MAPSTTSAIGNPPTSLAAQPVTLFLNGTTLGVEPATAVVEHALMTTVHLGAQVMGYSYDVRAVPVPLYARSESAGVPVLVTRAALEPVVTVATACVSLTQRPLTSTRST
jgi:hypothetical protein